MRVVLLLSRRKALVLNCFSENDLAAVLMRQV